MAANPPDVQETLQLNLDPADFKALLRDLLFREAGKPYFKRLHIPRQRWQRLLGPWKFIPTYVAEQQLLPVGGRDTDHRIRTFFLTYERLQAAFHEGGMPVTAIHVLRQRCLQLNAALEHVYLLECTTAGHDQYRIALTGGPAPETPPRTRQERNVRDEGPFRL
jgi:hypothetical protein